MTDDEVRLKALVDAMRNLGDPLSGTSLYQQAATVIESLSRDLAAAKDRIAELEEKRFEDQRKYHIESQGANERIQELEQMNTNLRLRIFHAGGAMP